MNRQRGISSLALVLLLLLLGSLLLEGLNQQLAMHLWRVNKESQAVRQLANAHSAMAWGYHQPWAAQPAQPALQCLQHARQQWRACLRIFSDGSALLIAASQEAVLWRLGRVANRKVIFSVHGWSDFCPLKEVALCQLP